MPRGVRKKTSAQQACETFVNSLIEDNVIEEPELFIILSDEADSKGYMLEARQQGIRGTFISFRKK